MIEANATVSSTEMQNNFEKYLQMVMDGGEIVTTLNGKEVGRLIPKEAVVSYLTDSLTGILSNQTDMKQAIPN